MITYSLKKLVKKKRLKLWDGGSSWFENHAQNPMVQCALIFKNEIWKRLSNPKKKMCVIQEDKCTRWGKTMAVYKYKYFKILYIILMITF